jgi:hypothetical protein
MRAVALGLIVTASISASSEASPAFSTEHWCTDQITFCLEGRENTNRFSGIRVVADISPSLLFDLRTPLSSPTDGASFSASFGIETNLYKGILAIQLLYIKPSSVRFPLDANYLFAHAPVDGKFEVNIDFGLAVSLTALEGTVGAGLGYMWFDRESFISPRAYPSDPFLFVALQPVAFARLFKRPAAPVSIASVPTEIPGPNEYQTVTEPDK